MSRNSQAKHATARRWASPPAEDDEPDTLDRLLGQIAARTNMETPPVAQSCSDAIIPATRNRDDESGLAPHIPGCRAA